MAQLFRETLMRRRRLAGVFCPLMRPLRLIRSGSGSRETGCTMNPVAIRITYLQHSTHYLRFVAAFFKRIHDLRLMVGSECLKRDAKLHLCAAVYSDELVVLELDDITLLLCDSLCDSCQLTRLIRQQDRNCKNTISHDKSLLYD